MSPQCTLCPRRCGVDRLAGETGLCCAGRLPFVSSITPHFGEEAPLVGRGGSGTVFFSGCNLHCVFCQNFDISTGDAGKEISLDRLVTGMLGLQKRGCHNVNFVTPTHQAASVMEAVRLGREKGLDLPIVYNSGGYESIETLRLLEGFVDIYMPDMKFSRAESAARFLDAPDYPTVMREAVREMHRQVGDLEIRDGVTTKGLLVRHLVMPEGVEEGVEILDFLAEEISTDTYVNVMAQYRPMHRAYAFPEIARGITAEEYRAVYEHAAKRGLRLAR